MVNNGVLTFVLGPGTSGPVSTIRSELLRGGLEEADARVSCQNVLLDQPRKQKLDRDLARRCQEVWDERVRAL